MRAVDFPKSGIQSGTDADNALVTGKDTAFRKTSVSRAHWVDSSSETTQEIGDRVDERLVSYFESTDETASQQQLEYLLHDVAKPIIKRIVQHSEGITASGGNYSFEDVISEALLKLLSQLRALKANPHHQKISNFDGLVATITYRSIADYLRTQNRQRSNLEKKIRRIFASNSHLGIWKDSQQEPICGFQAKGTKDLVSDSEVYPSYEEVSSALTESQTHSPGTNTAELILIILTKVQRPARFRDLVEAIGQRSFRRDARSDEIELSAAPLGESLNADELHRLLQRLFFEIQKLGIEQRKSLLLNMTDSYGYSIEWFAFTGIATEAQLAELLQVSLEEFRLLLNDLPMTDKQIAKQLGISPTKVANIRKAVRDRLARCRRAFLKEEGR